MIVQAMTVRGQLAQLGPAGRRALWAGYLSQAANAFDFFLLAFLLQPIARDFGASTDQVARGLFLAVAARPMGALALGWLADRHGRRPVLAAIVLAVSLLSALSALAPALGLLIALRTLLGFFMGGSWGTGTALVMESAPPRLRGLASGLIQAGLPSGYLLASLIAPAGLELVGWRGLLLLGLVPAALALWIVRRVDESPVILARRAAGMHEDGAALLLQRWKLGLYLMVLMLAFTALGHATQDLYPVFLEQRYALGAGLISGIVLAMNLAGILGLLVFALLSGRLGHRRTIIVAALPALAVLPFWASVQAPVTLVVAAILMQVCVQGAWAMVPAWLAELSPAGLRATLPGFVYAMADLLTARGAMFQAGLGQGSAIGAPILALVVAVAIVVLATLVALGPERSEELA